MCVCNTNKIEFQGHTERIFPHFVFYSSYKVLAEKECPAKLVANPKFKAQEIENMTKSLQFVWDCGLQMSLKPSAENLLAGDEKDVSSSKKI